VVYFKIVIAVQMELHCRKYLSFTLQRTNVANRCNWWYK